MRYSSFGLVALLTIIATAALPAQSSDSFTMLDYAEHQQYHVSCAAHYECDIEFQAGEQINDGFNSAPTDWDPHVGYSGEGDLKPHLVLRPEHAGLRTNIILTTTRRTYYLLVTSFSSDTPLYYAFRYPEDIARMKAIAQAERDRRRNAVTHATPVPTPTPVDVANIDQVCMDASYAVTEPEKGRHAPEPGIWKPWIPEKMCNDGRHTFLQFHPAPEVPADLPIVLVRGAEGDTIINYTYNANLNRYVIDGVHDRLVLELGAQGNPIKILITHVAHGIQAPRPTPKPISTMNMNVNGGA
ncbi:MAG TPA: TrbG/VirB9 family P-type conjugative transfer protein [Candidatus Baltobacteraceae bacterium]|jgi:type IV secretion system protein VirB9|nr:TrbG/VirB9 family P-type conjugative transfer protein [Candidatus Baltobacteraceae bacterium]